MNALLVAHVGGGPVALAAGALAIAGLADMLCWLMRLRFASAIPRSKHSTNHGRGVRRRLGSVAARGASDDHSTYPAFIP